MMILAIDTSTEAMGIGLFNGKEIIGEYVSINKNKHSTRLMPAIDQLMRDLQVKPKDLTKIVVGVGPGSYTGVRIAISIAKTMAWSLKIPLSGISSLQALSLNVDTNHLICPFLDARRGLVFAGVYNGLNEEVLEEQNINMETFLEKLSSMNQTIFFISPDLEIYRTLIIDKMGESAVFLTPGNHRIRPGLLAQFGTHAKEIDPHHLVPNYLRKVEAEVKWLEKQTENMPNGYSS